MVTKMSFPTRDADKTSKYGPLRWKFNQQYPGYEIKQFNITIGVYLDDGRWKLKRQRKNLWDSDPDIVTQFEHCSCLQNSDAILGLL